MTTIYDAYVFLFCSSDSNVSYAFLQFLPLILSGLAGLGGALGNKKQTQTTQQTNSFNNQESNSSRFSNSFDNTSTTTPNMTPETQAFMDQIRNKYTGLMDEDPDLKGYQANQTGAINRLSDIQKQNMQETLASRGVGGAAASTSMLNADAQRFAQVAQLKNSIPLLSRQMREDILGKAGTFFSSIPKGSTTSSSGTSGGMTESLGSSSGNSTGTGTQTTPGNVAAGGVGSFAQMMAYLFGQGAFGGNGGNPTHVVGP